MSNPSEEWHEGLSDALYDAEEEGTLEHLEENYNLPLNANDFQEIALKALPQKMIQLYELFDGWEITWAAVADDEAGGRLHFLAMQHVMQNWEGKLYESKDLLEEELIEFFKPFDLVTDEAECGFLHRPGFASESIYYHRTGAPQLYNLDLDFSGYLEMALAARVYFYWPKVLLDIQSGEESEETTNFKQNMPLIFPEFNWEAFKEKYESLRLSVK
ncbi:hypothetical protein [Lewinella cohaerens]|uniref:hypothetical protein n=1 Tax=Lewinella cohaerens TaxID=70995 RepID=UPI000366AE78|nr:hypothetical protein [Lewinella cohaerens]